MITLKCGTEEQHRRGLLQICQDVHMTLLGTYERNHETGANDMTDDVRYLLEVVKGWEEDPNSDTALYDRAVLGLVTAVLAEVKEYAPHRVAGATLPRVPCFGCEGRRFEGHICERCGRVS